MAFEFENNGNQYKADKLPAFQQFHVSRRIAPLIPPLIPIFVQISKSGGMNDNLDMMAPLLQPFAEGLSQLSDDAAEYVISTCLSVVKRKVGDNWTAVWSVSGKVSMFADLNDMGALMPLVIKVIQDSLGPFINGLLTSKQTEAPPPA